MSAIRWAVGVSVIWPTVSTAYRMHHARVARSAFPPSERVEVLSMATRKPATLHCPATRWSLDDLVAALPQQRLQPLSRSSIWRILEEADLKPHRSVYWLNSHDPDFEAKAADIIGLYLEPPQHAAVFCVDRRPRFRRSIAWTRSCRCRLDERSDTGSNITDMEPYRCTRHWM